MGSERVWDVVAIIAVLIPIIICCSVIRQMYINGKKVGEKGEKLFDFLAFIAIITPFIIIICSNISFKK